MGLGTVFKQIFCDPVIVPDVIRFSNIVIVATAEQPCGVIISNFTVIDEVNGGLGEKFTDVCVTPADTVLSNASLIEN